MRQYIVNLTRHLVSKNNYVDFSFLEPERTALLDHIFMDLYAGDVAEMNPETLGKIVCSFETGDVLIGTEDLHKLTFAGDCEDYLRQFVALCLARVIQNRLEQIDKHIPKYRRA